MVESSYEIDLKKHGRSGTIFALKNFDWKDKSEVDNTIHLPKPLLDNVYNNNSTEEAFDTQEAS